jgi:cytosine/adenosine deaminase-related metal-dependent hydrolase
LGTLLRDAVLVELEPASVEAGAVRISEGRIVARGAQLEPEPDDEVISLHGKVLMPGLVCANHQLHATLLRGAPRVGLGFAAERALRTQLEGLLDLDALQAAATAGALEGLLSGVTTVFHLHASPKAIGGSLSAVARGLHEVGLRGALGYQISDRHGAVGRDEGLEESVGYAKKARGRYRALLAAQEPQALSPGALEALKHAQAQGDAFLHLCLAEDPEEEKASVAQYGKHPLARLEEAGLISERAILAHGVHLSWPELSSLLGTGAWLVHSARSNMESQTGTAAAGKFGVRACLGTATQALDVLGEGQAAWLRARDAGQPIDLLRYLANGQRLASLVFGGQLGVLQPGALADLVVLDYRPPTALDADTLAAHVLHGFSSRHVEAVMVDGIWRSWARKPLAVKPDEVAAHAREAARSIWAQLPRSP